MFQLKLLVLLDLKEKRLATVEPWQNPDRSKYLIPAISLCALAKKMERNAREIVVALAV